MPTPTRSPTNIRKASNGSAAHQAPASAATRDQRLAFDSTSPAYPLGRDTRIVRAQRTWCRHTSLQRRPARPVSTTTFDSTTRRPNPADVAGKLVVVGDVVRQRLKSPDGPQVRGAKQQRGPQSELAHAHQRRHQHAGREIGRDPQRLPASRPVVRPGPVQAGHQSHLGVFERAHNPPQIVRGDVNVAVVHQQQRVTGGLRQFHQHAHLADWPPRSRRTPAGSGPGGTRPSAAALPRPPGRTGRRRRTGSRTPGSPARRAIESLRGSADPGRAPASGWKPEADSPGGLFLARQCRSAATSASSWYAAAAAARSRTRITGQPEPRRRPPAGRPPSASR